VRCETSTQRVASPLQGIVARDCCKGLLQGIAARDCCKGLLQGIAARDCCKGLLQGREGKRQRRAVWSDMYLRHGNHGLHLGQQRADKLAAGALGTQLGEQRHLSQRESATRVRISHELAHRSVKTPRSLDAPRATLTADRCAPRVGSGGVRRV
jgi:hypothetical protein